MKIPIPSNIQKSELLFISLSESVFNWEDKSFLNNLQYELQTKNEEKIKLLCDYLSEVCEIISLY